MVKYRIIPTQVLRMQFVFGFISKFKNSFNMQNVYKIATFVSISSFCICSIKVNVHNTVIFNGAITGQMGPKTTHSNRKPYVYKQNSNYKPHSHLQLHRDINTQNTCKCDVLQGNNVKRFDQLRLCNWTMYSNPIIENIFKHVTRT